MEDLLRSLRITGIIVKFVMLAGILLLCATVTWFSLTQDIDLQDLRKGISTASRTVEGWGEDLEEWLAEPFE